MSFWTRFRNRAARPAAANPVAQAARATVEHLESRQLLTVVVGMGRGYSLPSLTEGGEAATYYVDREGTETEIQQSLTVNLGFRGLSDNGQSPATATDLVIPATVTFDPGQTAAPFAVSAVDDDLPEDYEAFEIYVMPGSGYTVDDRYQPNVVIESDVPNVWVEASRNTAVEGGQSAQFTFHRDNTEGDLTVTYAPWSDTAHWSEVTPPDPSLGGGYHTVTFADGEDAVTIDVPAVDDEETETTESFRIQIEFSPNIPVAEGRYFTPNDEGRPFAAYGYIQDYGDDSRYVWVTREQDASEDGRTPAKFTFHRSGNWSGATSTKAYFTLGGTATAGVDYTGAKPSQDHPGLYEIDFGSGYAATLTLTPANDADVEGGEEISVTVSYVQDQNGNGLYAPVVQNLPNMPGQANAMLGDLQARPTTDPAQPGTAAIDQLVNDLDDHDQQIRDTAEYTLSTTLGAFPGIEPYLDERLEQELELNTAPERIIRLRRILGPVSFRLQGNKILLSLRYAEPGVASYAVGGLGAASDPIAQYSVAGFPAATTVVVGGNPSEITITPSASIQNKKVTFVIHALDATGTIISSIERDFVFDIEEVWSI